MFDNVKKVVIVVSILNSVGIVILWVFKMVFWSVLLCCLCMVYMFFFMIMVLFIIMLRVMIKLNVVILFSVIFV